MPIFNRLAHHPLGRSLALVIAFGVLLWLGDLPRYPQGTVSQANARNDTNYSAPAAALRAKPAASGYQNPCYQTDDASQRDLCQQWRMAEATDKLVSYTHWQLIGFLIEVGLVMVGVGVAWYAAVKANEAAKETRRGANAGYDAVIATREIGQAGLRAYMVAYDCLIGITHDGLPEIDFSFKNIGQTPARNVAVTVSVYPVPANDPPISISATDTPGDSIPNVPDIWEPNIESMIRAAPTIDATFKTAKWVRFELKINYRDVFGVAHCDEYDASILTESRGRVPTVLTCRTGDSQ